MPADQTISEEILKKHFKKEGQDVKIIYLKLINSDYLDRFRQVWNLPENGFSSMNNYYKWRGEFLVKRTNQIITGKKYRAMKWVMTRKKQQWTDHKILFDDIDNYGLKIKLKEPMFRFDFDIEAIMTRLGIPERYEAFVEGALVLKKPPDYFMINRPLPKPFLRESEKVSGVRKGVRSQKRWESEKVSGVRKGVRYLFLSSRSQKRWESEKVSGTFFYPQLGFEWESGFTTWNKNGT